MQHISHLVLHFTFSEWIPLLLVIVVAALYLFAAFYSRSAKGGWNSWRTISFIVGLVLLGIAMFPSLMQWAHQDLVGHMVQHLLIGMYGPLFLVLGAPIMLALKTLLVNSARSITAILRSSFILSVTR
jgi:putative membrane protein